MFRRCSVLVLATTLLLALPSAALAKGAGGGAGGVVHGGPATASVNVTCAMSDIEQEVQAYVTLDPTIAVALYEDWWGGSDQDVRVYVYQKAGIKPSAFALMVGYVDANGPGGALQAAWYAGGNFLMLDGPLQITPARDGPYLEVDIFRSGLLMGKGVARCGLGDLEE